MAPPPPPPTKYIFYSITCYNKMYVSRTRIIFEQECGPVTVFEMVIPQMDTIIVTQRTHPQIAGTHWQFIHIRKCMICKFIVN